MPHPFYTHGLDYYGRDLLDREEFSGREYLLDASEDLAVREPSFFGRIKDAALAFSSVSCIANPLNPVL